MPLTPTELLYIESKTESKLLKGNYKCRVAVVFISETPGWNTLFRICSGDVDVSVSQNIETTPTVWSNLHTGNTAITLGMETRVRFNSPKQVGRNKSSLIDVLEDCEGLVLVYDVMDWIGFGDLPIYSAYTSHRYHPEGPGAPSKDVRQEEQKPPVSRVAESEPQQKQEAKMKQETKMGQKADLKPKQKQKRPRMMRLSFKGPTERTLENRSIPETPERENKSLNTVGTSHTPTTSRPIFPPSLAQPGPFLSLSLPTPLQMMRMSHGLFRETKGRSMPRVLELPFM